jgi:predicted CoA-binding protein
VILTQTETDAILRKPLKRINRVWVQQMSETKDTVKIAAENHVDLISKKCIFMFANPVTSIHKFHRTIVKWLGRLPK